MKRAAVYARVSTAEQVDGTSLRTQVERCEHHIAAQGWAVADRYVDEGVSGAKASRPALDRLLMAVRTGTVDTVVVAKLDRIGRSMRHLGALLGELDDRGVALVSVSEAFDSSTASGRLQRNMLGSFAEFERELIRDRMISGRDAVVRSGSWSTTKCPYGYRAAPPDYRLQFHPGEIDVLRLMVDLFVNHRMTGGAIARELNVRGHRRRQSGQWDSQGVRGVLRDNDHFGGTFTWRRPGRGRQGPPIAVPGPVLLDPATHQRLRHRIAQTAITHRTSPDRYLLSGLLTSPHGTPMYGVTSESHAGVYRCADTFPATAPPEGRCRQCRSVRAEVVEDLVWDHVVALLCDPTRLLAMAGLHLDRDTSAVTASADDVAVLDRKIARLESAGGDQLSQLLGDGLDPAIAAHAARTLTEQLTDARNRRQRLVAWQAANLERHSRTARLLELAERARTTLPAADRHTRIRVLALLDLHVKVTGWDPCTTCAGKGLIPHGFPRRRYRHGPVAEKAPGTVCPACHRHRWLPRLVIDGTVPEAELDTPPASDVERWPFRVVQTAG